MSRYLVRAVGQSGIEWNLGRGRLRTRAYATLYSSPSTARKAIKNYCALHPAFSAGFVFEVIDTRDPERSVA